MESKVHKARSREGRVRSLAALEALRQLVAAAPADAPVAVTIGQALRRRGLAEPTRWDPGAQYYRATPAGLAYEAACMDRGVFPVSN